MMLSIAILDDNIKILEDYEQLITACFSKNNINGKIVIATTDYKDFVKDVRSLNANVCIIDINLRAEVNGLYIAKCLRKEGLPLEIIFCTGLLEYMPQAFDVNAYHYLIKPAGRNLEKCLVKLNKEIETRENSKNTLEIRIGHRIYYIPIETITHIKRERSKTYVYTPNRVLEVYESLNALYTKLNDKRFIKCHRATIVNKDYIDYVDKKNRCLQLTDGNTCELSTNHFPIFYAKNEE